MSKSESVAIALHTGDDPWTPWGELPDEDTSFGTGKSRRRAQAKIAIEAMSEPTEAMADDARVEEEAQYGQQAIEYAFMRIWRAMIAVALRD